MEIAELRQLVRWLEEKKIELFELDGVDHRLRLSLRNRDAVAGPISVTIDCGEHTADRGIVVAAGLAGIFRVQHPAHPAPLARLGGSVRVGDVIGLVQVGALYAPVSAPRDGALGKILAVPETLVGFGTPLFEVHPAEAAV